MKALARSYIWWPGMDREIEQAAKVCTGCELTQNNPKTAPTSCIGVASTPTATYPCRFCGTILRNNVSRRHHLKWPEVIPMTTTSAKRTIEDLRKLFAKHGLPEQLVSDDGSQFTSDEFRTFMRKNGIKHTRSTPNQLQMEALNDLYRHSSQLLAQH